LLTSCQKKAVELGNNNSLDRFLITLSRTDYNRFKNECENENKVFTQLNSSKLNERLNNLNAGFIKSLFVALQCTGKDLNSRIRNILGTKVMLYSPQIFFENLIQVKDKVLGWEQILLEGDESNYNEKSSLIRNAPTDTQMMKNFKQKCRELLVK